MPDCHQTTSLPFPVLPHTEKPPWEQALGMFLPVATMMEGRKWEGRRSQGAPLSFPPSSILGVFGAASPLITSPAMVRPTWQSQLLDYNTTVLPESLVV